MACIYTYKGKTYTYSEIIQQLRSENKYSDKELNQLLNTSELVQKFDSMGEITNHSGGAYGADTLWDILGRTFGVTKHTHYRGSDNINLSKKLRDLNVKATVISDKQLELGYTQLESIYGRKFEKSLANDLKARNYFQIINSDAVYAVGKLDTARVNVSGGTAASIDMAKGFKKPIYVYDIGSFGWFKFNGVEFIPTETPTLTKNFAGIGTRDVELYSKKDNDGNYVPNPKYLGEEVEEKVRQAIIDVYEKTSQALTISEDSQQSTSSKKEINIYSSEKNGFEGLSNLNNGPVSTPFGDFQTVEHAYQFAKATFVENAKVANAIKTAKTGLEAQQLGSKRSLPMTAEQSSRWDLVSTDILKEIMGLAFEQNPKQLALLKSTGNATLTHKDPKGKVNLKKWESVFPDILTAIRDGEVFEIPTISTLLSSPGQDFEAPWEDPNFKDGKGPVKLVFNNTPGQANAVLEGYGFDEKNDGATNARNVLTVISQASESPIFKALSLLLLRVDNKFNTLANVNFVLGEVNQYQTKTATITLDIKDPELVENFQYVFLHELVHHFTVGKLLDGSDQSTFIRNRIKRFITILEKELVTYATGIVGREEAEKLPQLLSELRQAASKGEAPDFNLPSELSRSLVNGLTDEFEFLAHLLNDQVFQTFANTYKDTDGRSLVRSVLDMIKAVFNNLKKALGIKVIDDSILDEGLDAALQVLQNYESDAVATDEYKYYGQPIAVALNDKGQGIDIPNLKRGASETQLSFLNRKAKILDAYNENPNVDPQNPDKPFRGTKQAIPEKPYDPQDKYIIKYLPNGTPIYANEMQRKAIDAAVEHFANTPVFEEPQYEPAQSSEDQLWQIRDRNERELLHNSYLISGSGGTGKTASVFAAIKAFSKETGTPIGKIHFAAPTPNAVKELQAAIDDKDVAENNVSTVASFLGTEVVYEDGVERFEPIPLSALKQKYAKTGYLPGIFTADYVVLDEVSMFGSKMTDLLLQRIEERAKLTGKGIPKFLLMGDYKQIPPVEEGKTKDYSIDRDSMLINLRAKPDKSTLLTKVMRTDNPDVLGLLQLYIDSIDKANDLIDQIYQYDEETGQVSSLQKVVPANPNNLKLRKDSLNIKYHYNEATLVDSFISALQLDPTNVRQAVIVNYNAYSRPETQSLITKIRSALFGADSKNDYNVGELLIASTPIKISDEKVVQINERLMVLDVKQTQFKKRYSNEYGDTYLVNTPGYSLRVKDAYGEDFTIEVPNKQFISEAFKNYDKSRKGFVYKGEVIPYGLYASQIKSDIGALNYGYVVNTHKVRGSTYNHVFVDEGNILKYASLEGHKPINQFLYTAFSRTKHKLHILNVENPIQRSSTFTEEIVSPTLGLPKLSTVKATLKSGASTVLSSLIPAKPSTAKPKVFVPEIEKLKAIEYQEHQIINLAKQITKVYNDPSLTDAEKTQKITENRAKIDSLRFQISDQMTSWSIQKLIDLSDQAFNSMDKVLNKPHPDVFEIASVSETYLFFTNLLGITAENYGAALDPTLELNLKSIQDRVETYRTKLTALLQETTQVFIEDKTGVSYSLDELYKNNTPSSWFSKLLGAYQADVKMISSIAAILQKAFDRTKFRTEDLQKRDEESLSKFLKQFTFKDILRVQTSKNRLGEERTVTQYKTRYLDTYYNARSRVFRQAISKLKSLPKITAADMKKKKDAIKKGLDAIEFSVDVRFLYPSEYNALRKQPYLPANAPDIYIAELKKILKQQFGDLGDVYVDQRLDDILLQANEKFQNYLQTENAFLLSLQAQGLSQEEIDAELNDFQAYNHPMLWLDEYKDLHIAGHTYYFSTPKLSALSATGKEQFVKDGEYDAQNKFVKLRHADSYLITKAKRFNGTVNLDFYDESFLSMEKEDFEASPGTVTKMQFLDWAIETEKEYAKMYPSYLRRGRMYFQMADIEKGLMDIWDEATLKGKVALLWPIFLEKITLAVSEKLPITTVANKIDTLTGMYKRHVKSMNYDNSLNKAGKGDMRQLNPDKYFKAVRESAIYYSEMTNIETNIRLAQTLYDLPEGLTFIQKDGLFGKTIKDEFGNPVQFKTNQLLSTNDKEMLVSTINSLMYGGNIKSPKDKPVRAITSSGKTYQLTVKEKQEIARLEKDITALQKTETRLKSFRTLSTADKIAVLKDMKIIGPSTTPSITWVVAQTKLVDDLAKDVLDRKQEKERRVEAIKTSRFVSFGTIINTSNIKSYLSMNFLGWNPTGRIPDFLQNGIFGNLVASFQGVDFGVKDFSKALMYITPTYGIGNLSNVAAMYALVTGQWWFAVLTLGMSRTYKGTNVFGALTNALTSVAVNEAKETKLKLLLQRYKVFETSRNLSDSDLIATTKENIKFFNPGNLLTKVEELNKGITVLSKLYAQKVKDLSGKERSIMDGYIVKADGTLGWDTSEFPPLDVDMEADLIGRMTGVINEVHGNYSNTTPTMANTHEWLGFALLFRRFIPEAVNSTVAGFISDKPKYNAISKKHYIGTLTLVKRVFTGMERKDYEKAAFYRLVGQIGTASVTYFMLKSLHEYVLEAVQKAEMGGGDDKDLPQEVRTLIWMENLLNMTYTNQLQFLDPTNWNRKAAVNNLHPILKVADQVSKVMEDLNKIFIGTTSDVLESNGQLMTLEEADAMSLRELRSRKISLYYKYFNWKTGKWEEGSYERLGRWRDPKKLETYYENLEKDINSSKPQKEKHYDKSRTMTDLQPLIPFLHTINSTLNTEEEQFLQEK